MGAKWIARSAGAIGVSVEDDSGALGEFTGVVMEDALAVEDDKLMGVRTVDEDAVEDEIKGSRSVVAVLSIA